MNKFDIVQISEPDLQYLKSILILNKATPETDTKVKEHNEIINRLLEHVRLALPCYQPIATNQQTANYVVDKLSSID